MENNSDHVAVQLDAPDTSVMADLVNALKRMLDAFHEDPFENNTSGAVEEAYEALAKAKQNNAGLDIRVLLASLPKTADGIPIVPGMTVYCIAGRHVDEREVIGPYGKLALMTSEPARHGAGPGQCHRLANTVYSTFDAAKSGINSDEPQAK